MPDPAGNRAAAESPSNGSKTGELAQLRRLLIGEQLDQLSELQHRLDDPARRSAELGEVLPEALKAARQKRLSKALEPLFEGAFQHSVDKHPDVLAKAVSPLIGSAIRKAIAAALREMTDSLSQIVEKSASLRALRWRIEARMTGKSFTEILLARSLRYSVEQVFLIHRKKGLLLQHAVAKAGVLKDADMISGMLSAIQSFMDDSLTETGQELDTVGAGEVTLWIQYGPQAVLAGAVRGSPPAELKAVFQQTLEDIHGALSSQLSSFQGDTAPFEAAKPYLEACLLGQSPPQKRRSVVPWLLAAAAVAGLAVWAFLGIRERLRWDNYLQTLKSQPGIVITAIEKRGSDYIVSGFRDPLAVKPDSLLNNSGIPPERVRYQFEQYSSSDPGLSSQRNFLDAKKRVETQVVRFEVGSPKLELSQAGAIEAVAAAIRDLFQAAAQVHRNVRITVVGHTDESGSEATNTKLSRDRAEQVTAALVAQGLSRDQFAPAGVGRSQPLRAGGTDWDRATNRSVSFQVLEANR